MNILLLVNRAVSLVMVCCIRVYQYAISPLLGPTCRFRPTCSQYFIVSLQKHGAVRGCWLGIKRISRCHPWHSGGYDPPP